MPALKAFFKNLASDSSAMKKFQSDPQGAMKHAGLSASDMQLVASKDASGLASRLKGPGLGAAADSPTVIVVVV